jgi:signal transduction histidine kinase
MPQPLVSVGRRLPPSMLLCLLLFGVLAALWGGFAWLTIREYEKELADHTQELGDFSEAYAQYAAAVADAESAAGRSVTVLEPGEDRGKLAAFVHALRLPAGAHLQLMRLADGAVIAGDSEGVSDLEAAVPDAVLTAHAERQYAGIAAVASWTRADALADWRTGALYEGSGIAVLTGVVILLGILLAIQLRRRELALVALRESKDQLMAAHVGLEAGRSELERQLHHSQKLDSLGTLAGGVAHDLNNTLVPVLALGKVVRNGLLEGSRDRRNMDTIVHAGERARDLVGQILAFTRKEKAETQVFDLREVAAEAINLLRASVSPAIRIEQATGEIPLMAGYPGRLHQVIVNLVVNASHAIGDGAGTIGVALEVVPGDPNGRDANNSAAPTIRLSVRDSGQGMDEATIKRIFEPFFTTKKQGEGTGLGLSVVQSIIAEHGGTITAESRVGHGTCFNILLPALTAGQIDVLNNKEQGAAA